MEKKKIIIIGSSIAGASAAFFLAPYADVVVYEQKARSEIGKKVCANVVTSSFLKYAKVLGLNPKKYIISEFDEMAFFSENNKLIMKTREFKIDRRKLVEDLILKAEKKGAKFVFNVKFIDYEKRKNEFIVKLKHTNKILIDNSNVLIGADGAFSEVAKKAGLWKNRRFCLTLQAELPLKKLKKIGIKKGSHHIYLGKKFGYYSYIFPSKDKIVVGVGDVPEKVKEKYKFFMKFLHLNEKEGRMQAALIPEPQIIPQKNNLFLIGDAGCHLKFSGGGIVPSIIAANAVKEIIISRNFRKMRELNRRTLFNRLATKVIWNLKDRDFDNLLEIMKDKKFSGILEKRDEFGRQEYLKAFDFRILKFLLKLL